MNMVKMSFSEAVLSSAGWVMRAGKLQEMPYFQANLGNVSPASLCPNMN